MADINYPVFRMPSLLQEVIRWEQDLAKVPIICVSPMDFDNAVRLVACNLRQFFQLWFSHDGWGRALLLNDFESDEAYACHIRKQMEETCASDSFDIVWHAIASVSKEKVIA